MPTPTITIERLDQEPFTVRRGDRVNVWFNCGRQEAMTVVGLSPSRGIIRVRSIGAVRKDGFEVEKERVYPVPTPATLEASKKPSRAAPLSEIVATSNANHEPPGGFSETDALPAG